MASLSLKNIKKIYPHNGDDAKQAKKKKKKADEQPEKKVNLQITEKGVVAVQEFNLEIADKEFIVLVGPSGCGKSTTLRMVAGLEDISEGELWIGDRMVNDMPPKERDIAMVFQNYALYYSPKSLQRKILLLWDKCSQPKPPNLYKPQAFGSKAQT